MCPRSMKFLLIFEQLFWGVHPTLNYETNFHNRQVLIFFKITDRQVALFQNQNSSKHNYN